VNCDGVGRGGWRRNALADRVHERIVCRDGGELCDAYTQLRIHGRALVREARCREREGGESCGLLCVTGTKDDTFHDTFDTPLHTATHSGMDKAAEHFRHTRELRMLGVRVVLIGTAHISVQSVKDVEALVRDLRPEGVYLELCRSRAHLLTAPRTPPKPTPLTVDALRRGLATGGVGGVFQIVLTNFMLEAAAKVGSEVSVGQEFAAAAQGVCVCV
jgi:hypothetical protein